MLHHLTTFPILLIQGTEHIPPQMKSEVGA